MQRQNQLKAKVTAVNAANRAANELYPTLAEIFRPFVGQQVVKADRRTLLQRVEKLLPPFVYSNGLHVYKSISDYSLRFSVKVCESYEYEHRNGIDNACVYHEADVYVGIMRDGFLESIADPFTRRTDYTVQAIEDGRRAYEAAKKESDRLLEELQPFGE